MRIKIIRYAVRMVVCFAMMISLGCLSQIRKHTYPPDFRYIEKKDVKNAMWKFAFGVMNLERILNKDDPLNMDRKIQVVEQLKKMENIAAGLGTTSTRTNHALIDENLDGFREHLRRARMNAELSPPNFYLAGQISGACTNCHAIRPWPVPRTQ